MTVIFLSRGFPVTDLRRVVYDSSNVRPDERFAITGDVQEFWFTHVASSRSLTAIVKVQLRVYDTESGEMVWEKPYSSSCTGTRGWDVCNALTTLRAFSLQVTKDSALVDALIQKTSSLTIPPSVSLGGTK